MQYLSRKNPPNNQRYTAPRKAIAHSRIAARRYVWTCCVVVIETNVMQRKISTRIRAVDRETL